MQIMQVMEISTKDMEVQPNSISDLKVDASFRKIAKNAISFHIWKIDDDRLEAEAKAHYGTFYDDCAYIIYAASPIGVYVNQDTITREVKASTNLERFIHFWLGEKVSEQKRSNVAHKIQELDSYFGNVATEYREAQDNESARFLSYFKRGLNIRCGALASAAETTRLYQLRGRKWLRCVEMESISWAHFSSDYIMLLKTNPHVYLWIGRSSSLGERRDAIECATRMQSNYAEITIVDDGYEQSLPEKRKAAWNAFLPLTKRQVSQHPSLGETTNFCHKLKIYKCGYRNTRLHLDQLDVIIPTREDLADSTTTYVLDGCTLGVWLWVGAMAPALDNISAMGNGRAFVKKKKYAYATPVIRVVEGHEPIEFTRLFPNWHSEWNESKITYKPVSTMLGKFDSLTLCQRPKMAADTQLIDNGSGERKIFRITKDQVIEQPVTRATVFITSNCYVVQYSVMVASAVAADAHNVGIKTIVYQWNGAEAGTDVITKCERFAKASFEELLLEKAMFVQMCEFDETPHFLQIFDGKLIVLQSDKHLQLYSNNNSSMNNNNSSINNKNAIVNGNGNVQVITNGTTKSPSSNHDLEVKPSLSLGDYIILKVYGDASYNSKAVEVYPLTSMISKDCYVVRIQHVWVWCGHSSTGDAREVAKQIGSMLGECSLVMEGKEPPEFWRSIAEHTNQTVLPISSSSSTSISNANVSNTNVSNANVSNTNVSNTNISVAANSVTNNGAANGSRDSLSNGSSSPQFGGYLASSTAKTRPLPQLFIVWLQHGRFYCSEIIGFEQRDLAPEAVYVLDTGMISFIWLGDHVTTYEREKYLKIMQFYLETVPITRRPTTAVAVVRQNHEPNVFKGFFENWNNMFYHNYISYEQKRQLFVTIGDVFHGTNDETNRPAGNGDYGSSPLPTALLHNQKDFDRHHKYPIRILQQEVDLLPAEVNPLKREVHLTHDDFVALFHMSFGEFDQLSVWRKQELKKKYKLF